jgi:hypothetical protein
MCQARKRGMKNTKRIKKIIALVTGITGLATLTSMSGPVVIVQPPAPVVTVQVPAPVITVAVPDAYVWDGFEFVGIVGMDYFYLGAGGYWVPCDSVRLARFQGWEKVHADWRAHATANVNYRLDARGHVHPWHGQGHSDKDDQGHDHGH